MENLLPSLAQSVAVAGFIAAAFSGVVLRPIYNVITELKEAIKELRDGLKEIEQDRRMMNDRLIRVEESVKSAHHRIDALEAR